MQETKPPISQLEAAMRTLEIEDSGQVAADHWLGVPKKSRSFFSLWPMFLVLVGVEILFYILTLSDGLQPVVWNIGLPLLWPAQIIFFLTLAFKFLLAGEVKKSFMQPLLLALSVGVAVAVFKFFWYFKVWNFYNLFFEPLVLLAWALLMFLLARSGFKIFEIIKFNKDRVKNNLNI